MNIKFPPIIVVFAVKANACQQFSTFIVTYNGDGWTVFQRRQDRSVDFYHNWVEYEEGSGNVTGKFWLGLSKIHHLTPDRANSLRVDLGDFENNTPYAQCSTFSIGNNTTELTLGYSGTAGDGDAIYGAAHNHSGV